MREDNPGQWMVALQAGYPLLARVTQRSAHTLQLRPGLHVFARSGHCHRELMGGSHLCAGAFPAGQEATNERHGTRRASVAR
jgi:hypothetical protein